MAKLIHSMIRILDLERSTQFYQKAFQLEVVQEYVFDGFTLRYLKNQESDFEIELTHNHDQKEPYQQGNAYGHIAVCVNSLASTHQHLVDVGLEPTPIKTLQHNQQAIAKFFFISDPDGYKIEVLENFGRYH